MNASRAIIVVGIFLVVAAAMTVVMMRLNQAEGGVGPCPGEDTSGYDFNTHFNGNYF